MEESHLNLPKKIHSTPRLLSFFIPDPIMDKCMAPDMPYTDEEDYKRLSLAFAKIIYGTK